jgi:hypothetical protein
LIYVIHTIRTSAADPASTDLILSGAITHDFTGHPLKNDTLLSNPVPPTWNRPSMRHMPMQFEELEYNTLPFDVSLNND